MMYRYFRFTYTKTNSARVGIVIDTFKDDILVRTSSKDEAPGLIGLTLDRIKKESTGGESHLDYEEITKEEAFLELL